MMRRGFQRGDIYNTIVGVGLPGEQVQLLLDRVQAEFEEANLASRASVLAEEISRKVDETIKEMEIKIISELRNGKK